MKSLLKKAMLTTCLTLTMLTCLIFVSSQKINADSFNENMNFSISQSIEYGTKKEDISIQLDNNNVQIDDWQLYDKDYNVKSKIDSAGPYYIGIALSVKNGDYFNMSGMMGEYFGSIATDNGQIWQVNAYSSIDVDNHSFVNGEEASDKTKLYVELQFDGFSIDYANNVTDDSVSNMPEDTNTYIKGMPVTISTQIPTRDGFDFIGWNTDKDAKTALTFADGKYTIGTSDVTLYAVWGHKHNDIVFDKELTNANLSNYLIYNDSKKGYYLAEGNYYLKENLSINNSIRIYETVNLCLNGFIIDAKNVATVDSKQKALADSGSAIRLTVENDSSAVLNLFDCGNTKNKFSEDENSKWILDNSLLEENVKHVINGGGIVNAPGNAIWIEIGKLNFYGGTISGNKRGVTISQNAGALSLYGDATIIDNQHSNLMLSINSFAFPPDFIKIDVSDNFIGKVGITLKDLYDGSIKEQYGVFSTTNNVDLHEHFYSDLDEYTIVTNSKKCLEVIESATVKIVDQKGKVLKTIKDVYSGHEITLPTELKKGYDFTEYYYYDSIFKITIDKGGILTIPKKDTELNADLFIVFTKQPTADNFKVETEAENVKYQWYEREKTEIPVAFDNGGSDSSYWASNNDMVVRNQVYHVTFPNGIPEGLKFNTGTVTKTGENTYDIKPGFIWRVGFVISIDATEPIDVEVTYDKYNEKLIEGETSSTLSNPKYDRTYFCRVTDEDGIIGTNSNLVTREFSIDETPQDFTCGDTDMGFEVKGTTLTNFVVEYYVDGTWTTSVPTNKGSYNVRITRAEDDEYKAVSIEIDDAFIINAKDITVTAEDKTMYYGDSLPTFTAKVEGLLGADTIDYSFKEVQVGGTGVYSIVPIGDFEQGNYNVQYVQGTLTVESNNDDTQKVDLSSIKKVYENYCEKDVYAEKKLDVEIRINENVSQIDKDLIAQKIGSNNKTIYKNVELVLIVDNGEEKEEINIGDENDELISVQYNFDFSKKKSLKTFRVHNNEVEELTTTANEDGESVSYDTEANTITVNAKKYSAYVFTYQDDVEIDNSEYVVVNTGAGACNSSLKFVSLVSLVTIASAIVLKNKGAVK